jgi:hypothetical protein
MLGTRAAAARGGGRVAKVVTAPTRAARGRGRGRGRGVVAQAEEQAQQAGGQQEEEQEVELLGVTDDGRVQGFPTAPAGGPATAAEIRAATEVVTAGQLRYRIDQVGAANAILRQAATEAEGVRSDARQRAIEQSLRYNAHRAAAVEQRATAVEQAAAAQQPMEAMEAAVSTLIAQVDSLQRAAATVPVQSDNHNMGRVMRAMEVNTAKSGAAIMCNAGPASANFKATTQQFVQTRAAICSAGQLAAMAAAAESGGEMAAVCEVLRQDLAILSRLQENSLIGPMQASGGGISRFAEAEKYVELTAPSAMVPVDEAWRPSTSLQPQKGKWKEALQMQPGQPGQRAGALPAQAAAAAPAAARGGGAGPSSYDGPGHGGHGGGGHHRSGGYYHGGRRHG